MPQKNFVLLLIDYDEEEGELPEEKQVTVDHEPSSTEINNLSDKLEKVMEEGELKESDTEEGEMKDSDAEEGEIKDEGEEGEILSDDDGKKEDGELTQVCDSL